MVEEKDFRYIVRIANADLDGNKPIKAALKKIKGVNFSLAKIICLRSVIDKNKKTGYLSKEEINKINSVITDPLSYNIPEWILNNRKNYETGEDKHLVGLDLKLGKESSIKRLQRIKTNRGMRLAWNLPVRGQRTRSNFRPNKGKVVGVKRKKGVKSGRV